MLVEIIASSGGFCKRIERGTGRIGDPLTQRRDWLRDFMKTADENAAGADYTNCLLSFGRKHGMISSVGGAVEHRLGRRRADPQSNHSLSREAEGTGPMKPGNLRRCSRKVPIPAAWSRQMRWRHAPGCRRGVFFCGVKDCRGIPGRIFHVRKD